MSNIKYNERILALGDLLNKRKTKTKTKKNYSSNNNAHATCLYKIISTLTINNLFKQKMLYGYCCNYFISDYLRRHIWKHIHLPEIKNDCLLYARYIDDIFIIYRGVEVKLNYFLTNLKMMHDSIKFDPEKLIQSIAFLDTVIFID